MDIDSIMNVMMSAESSLFLIIIVVLVRTYVPKIIAAYTKIREDDRTSYEKMQREYKEQSDKIIDVATTSAIALERAAQALEHNSGVTQSIITTLGTIEAAFLNTNKT